MGVGLLLRRGSRTFRPSRRSTSSWGRFGFACLYSPVLAAVGLWFERQARDRHRHGRRDPGAGLIPAVLQSLLDIMTWRDALVVLGVVSLGLHADRGAHHEAADARGRIATSAAGGWALPPAVSVAVLSLPGSCAACAWPCRWCTCCRSSWISGRSPTTAASIMLTVMLSGSLGRVSFGMIADRIGSLPSYAAASALQTVTVYWFVTLQDLPSLYVLALIFGFGFSGVMTSLILCIRDAVPARTAGLDRGRHDVCLVRDGVRRLSGRLLLRPVRNLLDVLRRAVAFGAAHLVVVVGLGLALRLRRPGPKSGEPVWNRLVSRELTPMIASETARLRY